MIAEVIQRCNQLTADRDLIVIQDTTSFNLNKHYYRLKKGTGIGPIEDNFHLGFFLHTSLVLDAFSNSVLGIGDIQLWHRVYDDPNRQAKTRAIPLEQKESYKWLKACKQMQHRFEHASRITFVEDRDGDIYEQFATIPDKNIHLVVRVCKERSLANGGKFFETLNQQPCCGRYSIDITANPRIKRISRKALLEVRYKEVCLRRPADNCNKKMSESVSMYAVQVSERDYTGKDKICWKLLTTHPVTNYEQALSIIEIYRKRWYIEQLFRLLKKQGFEMEDSQLETGWAIRKLCILGLNTVVRVMQLMLAGEKEDEPAAQAFTTAEQQCLKYLNNNYEGKTQKQRNPYKPGTLLWAKWIIARIGGWKSYQSQHPPGPITLKRGLDAFNQIFNGWCLALKVFEDVGTQ